MNLQPLYDLIDAHKRMGDLKTVKLLEEEIVTMHLCSPIQLEMIPSKFLKSGELISSGGKVIFAECDYYKTIFQFGIDDNAIKMCCDYAIEKLNKFIDSL